MKKAAELLNVSRDTVADAKTILRDASEQVVEAVERGKETIHAAIKELKPHVAQNSGRSMGSEDFP